MHIPDGFLEPKVLAASNVISLSILGVSVRRLKKLNPERIPLMGVLATFVFILQLIAFPVIGGTSVHLDGIVLCALLLGPHTGVVISFSTLLLQAFLFQHGGILSIGANFLNIGVVSSFLGYLIWRIRPTKLLAFISAFITTMVGTIFCVIELALSEKIELIKGMMVMGGVHSIAGVIEGLSTYLILLFIERLKPEILKIEKI